MAKNIYLVNSTRDGAASTNNQKIAEVLQRHGFRCVDHREYQRVKRHIHYEEAAEK